MRDTLKTPRLIFPLFDSISVLFTEGRGTDILVHIHTHTGRDRENEPTHEVHHHDVDFGEQQSPGTETEILCGHIPCKSLLCVWKEKSNVSNNLIY